MTARISLIAVFICVYSISDMSSSTRDDGTQSECGDAADGDNGNDSCDAGGDSGGDGGGGD
ncbi:MAG: hypothetical protein KA144_01235 [Xanthomonadaceae bacterium]|nr:hypothetical protein [Xanthomonadaceae bacterium]